MTLTSGKGHSSNWTNFKTLVTFTTGFGSAYNPSQEVLSNANLNSICNQCEDAFRILESATAAYKSARSKRTNLFKPLQKLITRSWNAFLAGAPNDELRTTVRSVVQKLRGIRVSGRLTSEEKEALASEGKVDNAISTSQLGYNELLENFSAYISLLALVPSYTPNEVSLKIESLQAYHADLRAQNLAVTETYQPWSTARIFRNEILYTKNTGLIDVALQVKAYVRSVFGSRSEEFKQISGLRFSRNAIHSTVRAEEPATR